MSKQPPLVSIVIPLFNSEAYLADTLNSVLNQNWHNKEILIIDDSSTDNSLAVANEFKSRYPVLIQIHKNIGKGACKARNYGYHLSKGDFIQFLDADDILCPNKIKEQVLALGNHTDKIAVCQTWHFFEELNKATNTDKDYLFTTDQPEKFFIQLWGGNGKKNNMVQTSAWLTPRELIEQTGGWNETLSKDQDGEFFARMVLNSKGIIYVPEVRNFYRKHIKGSNIASQAQRKHLESNLKSAHLKEKYLFNKVRSNKAKEAMAVQYKLIAINAWPRFKDISRSALKKSKHLGGTSFTPVLGGKTIELLKSLLGWKFAKSFSYYIHRIL